MRIISCELVGVPESLNQYLGKSNVYKYRNDKKAWTGAVYFALVGKRPSIPFGKSEIRIDYYFARGGRRDPDNYCGKLLLDGITKAGIIKDDNFTNIVLTVAGHIDKKKPRTVITITELEAIE